VKRFIAILLLVLFAAANSGAAITVHYCKGRVMSFALGGNDNKCCCKKKTTKKCCTTRTTVIQLKTNFEKTTEEQISTNLFSITSPVVQSWISAKTTSSDLFPVFFTGSPPGVQDHIILNRVFRI
jgi:hypothetical protein